MTISPTGFRLGPLFRASYYSACEAAMQQTNVRSQPSDMTTLHGGRPATSFGRSTLELADLGVAGRDHPELSHQ